MKKILTALLLFICAGAFAQNAAINNFLIKENLLKNSKLAIIAADSLEVPKENINGVYTFSVSGFTEELSFHDGVAVIPLQIAKSTFVYIKHENDNGTHSKLVYVYKKDGDLKPIPIKRGYLILIPVILIILAFAFKRFIYFALVVFLVAMVFGYSSGLNISTFFETSIDYLKNLV